MTVSMRVMHAGDGYKYLLRSVATGDGNRSLSTPLTRYYSEVGTPPGRWLGSGLPDVGGGRIVAGSQVTEAQLGLLIGLGRDPVTGDPLGRIYPEYKPTQERVDERVRDLDSDLSVGERAIEISRIEAEEAHSGRRAVAGYDFTFSVPKSVSVLWGVADANFQELIVAAHHAAIADVVDLIEREVAATRAGVANADGAVAQVATRGIIAAAYDHWDSRANDPQLHTHVVISNKVRADLDGRWRSLDSRPMHAAVTAVSAHYNAVLADRLTGMFGLGWEQRGRGIDRNPQWEIIGVGEALIKEFSSRTRVIEDEKERMIDAYVQRHGRRPNNAAIVVIRANATLATRPEKQVKSLEDLTTDWRRRAGRLLGRDATDWARSVASANTPRFASADQIPAGAVDEIGAVVVAEVARKRATWRRWNLWAEASRQAMHLRFSSAAERETVVARVVESAERNSVALTPPELAASPPQFRREDGTSVFRPRHGTIYSSAGVMAAEDRLLDRANDFSAPVVSAAAVAAVARRCHDGRRLTRSQAEAITAIATSRRQVDLLVGPAGAGKTTTMHALLLAWTREHGRRSVVGLAPSAAAAEVLAGDLGVACENTAKWLHDYSVGTCAFGPGQLVVIDEATLADTNTLDQVTGIAATVGAKVLLVGDWAQLQSIDAGGAFAMLAATRNDVAELTEIHRFTHDWERAASVDLRVGRLEAITAYAHHDRLHDGTTQDMLEAAYAAWSVDQANGLATILVTDSTETMHALNARARARRILTGQTPASREVTLASGEPASAGDLVITRRNDRRLRAVRGVWARNGDRWRIDKVSRDGSLTVTRRNGHAAAITLPAEYVAEHVDLGYAITAHRAQGVTVDTAHVLISARTTRESLYVSMTRGRHSNKAYVALDQSDETHASPPPGDDVNARTVLYGILRRSSAELSAHQTIAAESEAWTSIAQLAAEYDTIAAAAQRPRWEALLRSCGLDEAQSKSAISAVSSGPLAAALRRAEARGHNVDRLLPNLVDRGDLSDADDIGAVLQHRLRLSIDASEVKPASDTTCETFIAGLIPEASGSMAPEMRQALDQRKSVIENRAAELIEAAIEARPAWLHRLGDPPSTPSALHDWLASAATVVAYRDRYGITSNLPLGPGPRTEAEYADRRQALAAQRSATAIAARAPGSTRTSAPMPPPEVASRLDLS
ncbi:MobF family relaxase [Nocardioides sp. NPDC127514]|uniref:MobF family relaxase n=1 Tax=unclassified Nocardioides TaxID=2615069 RepID=UPI0033222F81